MRRRTPTSPRPARARRRADGAPGAGPGAGEPAIRLATEADRAWIAKTAGVVYRPLGDYERILGAWLDHPGVVAHVDVGPRGVRRGFTVLWFGDVEPPDPRPVADLLAIGVAPRYQGRGRGRTLLWHALDVARAEPYRARHVVLTVADDNARARALFASAGFEVIDWDYGAYDGGQRALRMARSLAPPPG